MKKILCLAFSLFLGILFCIPSAHAPGKTVLALTPPMGWNSWNRFACNVSEDLVKVRRRRSRHQRHEGTPATNTLSSTMLQAAATPSGTSSLTRKNFPNGIKPLAITSIPRASKFGIYSDAGTKTCWRVVPAAAATNIKTPSNTPPGASTISNTIGATPARKTLPPSYATNA